MEYTKNLRLSKPSYDDDVDVQVLNNNMDLLDEKVGNLPYLPLKGGKMQGNISIPFDVGLKYDDNHFLNFQQTSFNSKTLNTLKIKGDRLKYYSPSGKEFVVDDTGAWWNNDKLLTDLWTNIGWHTGYTEMNNKLLIQWGYVNPKGSTYNVQHVTFGMPFINPQYAVVTSRSYGVNNKASNYEGRWGSATFNMTTTGFDIVCAEPSAYGHTEFWIAIGKGVE